MGERSSEDHNEEFSPCTDDNVEGIHGETEQHLGPQAYIVFPSSTRVPLIHLPVAVRATVIRIINLQDSCPSNPHDMGTDLTFDAWDIGEDWSFDAWDIAEELPNKVQHCWLPVASVAA